MEPIGTITKYFPFLEKETQSVLASIMDEASNYSDFVLKLGHKACNEEVSQELAYMAALHADNAKERAIQEGLREKFKDWLEVVVWTFPMVGPAEINLYRDEVAGILNKVVAAHPPNWMLLDIYSGIERALAKTQLEYSEVVRKIEAILDSNEDLACFEMHRHWTKCDLYVSEGEPVKLTLEHLKGLEAAKKHDDVFWVMVFTGSLGWHLKDHSTSDAIEYLEEYNRLSILLGLRRFMALARNFMGITYRIRGEYDMALECQFAAIDVYYHETGPSGSMCAVISQFYSDIEDGKQAMHWANESFRITDGKGGVYMHHAMLLALLLLGNLDNADYHLNEMHKMSLESAVESDQATFLSAKGLYELKSGNSRAAIESLEQALSISEQLNIQVLINQCLIALTQAEIQIAGEVGKEESSGPWMVRLESHARMKDYPGIQMQAALLRAEFLAKQGRKAEAREVLQDALTILNSPTVKTLRTRIQKMLDDLIVA